MIVGAGFAGLAAAKELGDGDVDVTVVDRHNYHLFQPLLYQVATAGLSPADIAAPIRSILRDFPNVRVLLGEVSGIDIARQEVVTEGRRIPFDDVIIATGAQHAYFGHEAWEPFAPGLKTIDDATDVRRRILLSFEQAENEPDPEKRKKLLSFVVVGGGPTGVEMAGAIAELAKRALARDFRHIDPAQAHIILVEAGPRILSSFAESLQDAARRSLRRMGVQLRLNSGVSEVTPDGVMLNGERIEAGTVIWAAGVEASPAGQWLNVETDRAGRVVVGPDLSIPGHSNIFAVGDTAAAKDERGEPYPGIAPVAKQQGEYVAKLIKARRAGKTAPRFRYRDYGAMATIGRKSAVAEIGSFKISGIPGWLLWSVAHIYFLIGFRNRVAVALTWVWNYITFQRGTRLITGLSGSQHGTAPMETPTLKEMRSPPLVHDEESPQRQRARIEE